MKQMEEVLMRQQVDGSAVTQQPPIRDVSETEWERALRFLWLEVTNRCNLQCVHCYADSGPDRALVGTMTLNDWVNILEEGAENGHKGD